MSIKRVVTPVPEQAPKAPTHPKYGRPQKRWAYRDGEGRVLKLETRFADVEAGKVCLPCTCWETSEGQLVWRWKDLPTPRPIYGWDRVVRNPDAPVLVCEGPKACDGAEALFEGIVAVTSGSAMSAGAADWSPLRGRKVLIWPDADGPGHRYAQEVAGLLQGVAASTAIVGIPEGFPEGWDLADAPPEGWDSKRLRGLLEEASPSPSDRGLDHHERRLEAWTAGELLDLPVIPPRWVWEGWIPRSKVGLVTAASDHGKTALALQLGAALACGRPLFGIPTLEGGAGVLLVSFEDDAQEDFAPRLRMILDGMAPLTPEELGRIRRNFKLCNPTWNGPSVLFEGLRPEIERELDSLREQGNPPALVVIETLQAVMQGDENSTDSTRRLWAHARAIAKQRDVTVLISHHHRKETTVGNQRSDPYERMSTDRVRGSSANEGAARFMIQFAEIRPKEAESLGLDDEKALAKGYAVLRATKLKASKPPALFLERVDAGERGAHGWARRRDGDALIAAWMKSKAAAAKLSQEEAVLLELWKQRPAPNRDAVQEKAFPGMDTKKAKTAMKNALQNLREKGLLVKEPRSLMLTQAGAERAMEILERMPVSEAENLDDTSSYGGEPSKKDPEMDAFVHAADGIGWMDGGSMYKDPSIQSQGGELAV